MENASEDIVVVGSMPCRVMSEVHVEGSRLAQAANTHHGQV
jgi:hypothetical protein